MATYQRYSAVLLRRTGYDLYNVTHDSKLGEWIKREATRLLRSVIE